MVVEGERAVCEVGDVDCAEFFGSGEYFTIEFHVPLRRGMRKKCTCALFGITKVELGIMVPNREEFLPFAVACGGFHSGKEGAEDGCGDPAFLFEGGDLGGEVGDLGVEGVGLLGGYLPLLGGEGGGGDGGEG